VSSTRPNDVTLCLDIKRSAAAIGVSSSAVRGYIDRGLLPVVKFPSRHQGEQSRRVLVAVRDLEAFIEQYRVVDGQAEGTGDESSR